MGVRLNRRLVLEERVQTPDGAGGYTGAWQALGTLWAEIKSRRGAPRLDEGVRTFETRHQMIVRAAPPAASSRPRIGQRLREGDRVYAILSVDPFDPAGNYLTCETREEVAA